MKFVFLVEFGNSEILKFRNSKIQNSEILIRQISTKSTKLETTNSKIGIQKIPKSQILIYINQNSNNIIT